MTPPRAAFPFGILRPVEAPGTQALAVFVFSLLVTGALVAGLAQAIGRQDRLAFDNEVARTLDAIEQRVTVTTNLVRGTAGLFEASNEVTATDFRRYVAALELRRRYPGILGIGYTRWLQPAQVAPFEAAVRATGRPDFRVWPMHPRATYTSILHLEPLDRRNAAAIGYDMSTEPVRRAAMDAARNRRDLVASGKVLLVQEIDPHKQAGFLMYLPVYLEADGGRLSGFVYSPLRVDDLLAGSRGPGARHIDYEVFDGGRPEPAALLRTTIQAHDRPSSRFTDDRLLDVGGRAWLVRFHSRPALDALSRRWLVPWLALAALTASALLAWLSWLQGRARRRAEEAAAAQREAVHNLHREREWLGATLNSIAEGVVAVDAGGRVTWMNPVAERLSGWPREEALGRDVDDVVRMRDGDTGTGGQARGQVMLDARDGDSRPIDHSRAPIREANGASSGAVIVMHDASERHRIEAELRGNSRRKDEFLAMLAHELRNPLAPIGTAAALLRLPGSDPARVEHASAVIQRQVAHMTELVDDLLDVSRVTRGQITLELEHFDLRDAVRAALEQTHAIVERQRHRLEVRLDEAALPVRGDRTRLTQVVANLLNNAAKYTPPGGVLGVRAWRADDGLRVEVSDTGIGIDAELMPRIFDLFAQGQRGLDRAQGGLGIGLALVRSVVELHEGRVHAESAGPGRGSRFVVTLPAAAPLPAAAGHDAGPPAQAPRAALRIVAVDDNDDALQTLVMLLGMLGHQVRAHGTAEQALAEADTPADAYILDIGLPGMDGHALARRLRVHPRARHATLIALSGYGQDADIAASREAGFAAHLTKPCNVDDLLRVLAAVPPHPATGDA